MHGSVRIIKYNLLIISTLHFKDYLNIAQEVNCGLARNLILSPIKPYAARQFVQILDYINYNIMYIS